MARLAQSWLFVFLLPIGWACAAAENNPATNAPVPAPRLANGVPIDGVFQKATAEGLVIKNAKGVLTYSWKFLARGTRYRYERPFLGKGKPARKAAAPAPVPTPAPKPKAAPPRPPPVTNAPDAFRGRMMQIPSSRY